MFMGKTALVTGSTLGVGLGERAAVMLAARLCSTDAASITGAILPIEGGWTAH
jgi:hypothetical protein